MKIVAGNHTGAGAKVLKEYYEMVNNKSFIGILQELRETTCYYRQVDVTNEDIQLILLYNKSTETVCAQLVNHCCLTVM